MAAEIASEIQKFKNDFDFHYGLTGERADFFNRELVKRAQRFLRNDFDFDLDRESREFVAEYKKAGLGGFNATYGYLYHALIDFCGAVSGMDAGDLRIKAIEQSQLRKLS